MNKAIFLDRDGTINVDKKYLHKIEDFEFLPGVLDGMKMLQNAGYLLIVITNQSGIGRGYYSEKDFEILNSWMLGELESKGIHIARVYYCPHLPNAKIKNIGRYVSAVSLRWGCMNKRSKTMILICLIVGRLEINREIAYYARKRNAGDF